MLKDQWKHDVAVKKLQIIMSKLDELHRSAMRNIKEDGAIEVRNLCHDMMYTIDVFSNRVFKEFE